MAGVELALQFVGFKNIDLFSQGIYQLRVSAHGAHSGRQGVPFALLEAPSEANTNVPDVVASKEALLPAHILDATGEFCTPSFRVRFCEEEVMLRTMVRMRLDLSFLDVDLGKELMPLTDATGGGGGGIEHVTVMIKLMHARSTTTFDPGDDFARVEQESLKHFTVAATQTILIAMPLAAVSALYPITFSDWHFCYLPMLIHASPITCKLLRALLRRARHHVRLLQSSLHVRDALVQGRDLVAQLLLCPLGGLAHSVQLLAHRRLHLLARLRHCRLLALLGQLSEPLLLPQLLTKPHNLRLRLRVLGLIRALRLLFEPLQLSGRLASKPFRALGPLQSLPRHPTLTIGLLPTLLQLLERGV